MKNLIIIGGGTGGTIVANRVISRAPDGWRVVVVDPAPTHVFQPDLVFVAQGDRDPEGLTSSRRSTLAEEVDWVEQAAVAVDPRQRTVRVGDGTDLAYDLLVIASGASLRTDAVAGLSGDDRSENVHEFYTLPGAERLRDALAEHYGGRIVVSVPSRPIKGPLAPLEFLFLTDAQLRSRDIRGRVELCYAVGDEAHIIEPFAELLAEREILVSTGYRDPRVDPAARTLLADGQPDLLFDLLVVVPPHVGPTYLQGSDLADPAGFVRTDPRTLRARGYDNVFALGDATDLGLAKAGSVTYLQAHILAANLLRVMQGQPLEPAAIFHGPMLVATGRGKAMFTDFQGQEEARRNYPLRGIGPFSVDKETRRNHLGKRAMRWLYFHRVLKGKPLPGTAEITRITSGPETTPMPPNTTGPDRPATPTKGFAPPRRILLPTDFSPHARGALEYAAALAAGSGAELHLLHVFPAEGAADDLPPEQVAELQASLQKMRNLLGKKVEQEGQRIAPTGTKVLCAATASVSTYHAILTYAKEHEIDQIVMGTHGYSGLKYVLLGSVADKVVRHATCPVLVVKPGERQFIEGGRIRLRRLLFPTDLSPAAHRAAPTALALAQANDAEIVAVHVVTSDDLPAGDLLDDGSGDDTAGERRRVGLRQTVEQLFPGYDALDTVLSLGRVAPVVCELAEQHQVDLIVMASQGRDSVGDFLLGSVAERVLRHAPCAVWLVK